MNDLSANLQFSPCMHQHVVVDTKGGRRFVEGEVTDDILVRALCLDCGEYLSEFEVYGTWRGESLEESLGLSLDDDFGENIDFNGEEVKEWQYQGNLRQSVFQGKSVS